ncbi:globin domain-containing protein [Streptomyces pinistramenti]|uniref:globin domain-containing protein n=1 Tax=Streptomyces pinistramenti TaxID=2884812 RepID=UPI001D074F8B|nr:globin domain-containing protein [Streptomyces pinistramenti]MCB5909441.1 globin domain-containing protein [Streptomyces pinistramenti]
MDAPTTATADNGSSGGSSGDWGWFTPSKKSSEELPERSDGAAGGGDDREGGRPATREAVPRDAYGDGGHGAPGAHDGPADRNAYEAPHSGRVPEQIPAPQQERIPSRPVNPIRPVGTAAAREVPPAPAPEAAPAPARAPFSAFAQRPAPASPVHPAAPEPVASPAAPAAPTAPATPATRMAANAPTAPAAPAVKASPDAILIRRTMAEIEPVADKVTSYFYAMLFVQHPELRPLFPAAMDTQRDRLFKALLTAAQNVDDGERLTTYLSHLGRGHRKYGTQPEHYPAVGECLLGALSRYATSSWGPEAEAAWVRAYTAISQIMIDAAAENEAVAPAWWQAEVVSHELRTAEIAVVTVRPDQPYPFLAGQYTSLETPWWPRVWRHYSFAAAPRSDGLLSFHVKAVPAGWVSNALVHRARPGDILRLGGPTGSMTVDHSTSNGLLCVGGGTGIAPIKALVEDVATHGVRRPVEVFYGARSDHDLYDIDTMLDLEQAHPWLSVRPVVASGPAGGRSNGVSGELPDAVRQYGPWDEVDAYLSGPPGLIRSGVDALVGVGIPSDRIRHDSIDELVAAGD